MLEVLPVGLSVMQNNGIRAISSFMLFLGIVILAVTTELEKPINNTFTHIFTQANYNLAPYFAYLLVHD